jgi:Dolichyl-phosphate-mannose-protein mannosyltransferase
MRRVFLLVAWTALLWAAVVVVSGGFAFNIGGMRVSSQSPLNPIVFALVAGAGWMLAARGQNQLLAADLRAVAAPVLAGILGVVVVTIGFTYGALVAGGSDAYGYVSQADAWAAGTFRFDEPLIREFAGRVDRNAFVPLGYRAVDEAGTVVPMYPPGLPIVMSVFHRLGGREAVFYVVPLLAGLAVVATYVMGLRLGGKAIGLAGAALLATSPAFLYQLTAAPMSDVPVTAWWALALALVLVDHLAAALFSGFAVSLAILTRPNLAPLAVIPVAALIWEGLRDRASLRRAVTRAATYSAGVIPGCVLIGMLYAAWYGSPFTSGYGSIDSIYHWTNAWPNLARYPAWTAESQTPLVALAFAAPMLVSRVARAGRIASQARVIAWAWVGFIVLVLASYLLYEAFNAWWFLRFMLPAFPPLLVLTSVSIVALSQRLSRVVIPSALVAVMMWHGIVYAIDHQAFSARSERKYAAVADYVSRRLPRNAALLSMQHSGSIRYYSGRATVRFDHIAQAQLESTLAALTDAGYRPYILVEPWEVPEFRKRYAGYSPLSSLDWPPVAVMRNTDIRIYDPADRQAFLAGRPLLTETVP